MVSSQWILTWDVNHLLSWSAVKESFVRCNNFILEFKWNPWLESQSEKSRYIRFQNGELQSFQMEEIISIFIGWQNTYSSDRAVN
jgi:hypothetical protein